MKHVSEQEWKERLSPEQYQVLRKKGTEAPFSGALLETTEAGDYACGACGEVVFRSDAKFAAHCGWPSFYEPAYQAAVTEELDTSHGMRRVEITCSNCGSHLGHVFEDAPDQPTGRRYCINSLSLQFTPDTPSK